MLCVFWLGVVLSYRQAREYERCCLDAALRIRVPHDAERQAFIARDNDHAPLRTRLMLSCFAAG